MKQPIRMFIIGLDAEFVEHMTALAVGGVGEVVGSGPRAPETLNSLKEKHPRVCIVDGHGIERSYLDFVRRIHGAVPGVNVIIVGGHDEPPRIARAAASGAWNYVPYTVSRSDFALILSDAANSVPPQPHTSFGRARLALHPRSMPTSFKLPWNTPERWLRHTVRKCLSLGLVADDIAWHLGKDLETVRRHIKQLGNVTARPLTFPTRGARTVLALAGLVLAYKAVLFAWSLSSRRVGITGSVLISGHPLDTGVIEFRSLNTETAVVSGGVIRQGGYQVEPRKGLLPGSYLVIISSPETSSTASHGGAPGTSPPARERVPENFNTASSLRIEVRRFGRNVFDFKIP